MTRKFRRPRIVSLFTGAGGLDYGFECAGFETAVAIDFDGDSCTTVRRNREWPVIEGAIENVPTSEIREAGSLAAGSVDLLLGGPPCQPFSKSGYWSNGDTKRLNDPRARTLDEYMRCVEQLLPQVFVLENVHGISYSGKEEGLVFLTDLTTKINRRQGTDYQFTWAVLSAADYGVPQIRQRFFMVAHRDGRRFQFPAPTHRNPDLVLDATLFTDDRPEYATAWDAIGHITPWEARDELRLRGRWADLVPSIPEGENYLWHTNRKGGLPLFGWRTRYWSFLLKLAKNRPSWTIQAQPGPAIGPFHWDNRLLSTAELAAIQTFPSGIEFEGNRYSVQKQIGNAVPSLLAEVIARAIGRQFFDCRYPGEPTLAVPARRPIPPPAPVLPVPHAFHHLIGDHADHDPAYLKRRLLSVDSRDGAGAE